MNILFVDQFSEIGGAQKCFLDLLPAIQARGWTVHAGLPGNGSFAQKLREANVDVSRIPCGPYRSGAKVAADFARFPFDVAAQVQTFRHQHADLIYVNGPRVLPGAALASMRRTPVLFHAHNRLNHWYETRLARWSLKRATTVACCRYVAEPLGAQVIVPNGTPDMGFHERSFDSDKPRIGMIAGPSPNKGLSTFLKLPPLLPEARLVAVGQTVLSAPVETLPWQDDLKPVLSTLDLLLIPSQQEGLPRVMLEAFSAGVPVIAFPAGGIPEAIHHGETGFLTRHFTAEALAAAIQAALADPPTLQRVAATARQHWEQRYNLDLYHYRMIELIEQTATREFS